MAKYDDILNELVYQIDDVVYSFYSESNEIISRKQNQERLLDFREKTIATINDMNVRSLEIISQLKDENLVRERAVKLLEKNEELASSAIQFIEASTDKSELIQGLQKFSDKVYESAKEIKQKVDESGVVERLLEGAQEGVKVAQKGIEQLNQNPQFVKGKGIVIEKSKEALNLGAKWLKEGSKNVNDNSDTSTDSTDFDQSEIFKETVEDLESLVDEVVWEEKSDSEL